MWIVLVATRFALLLDAHIILIDVGRLEVAERRADVTARSGERNIRSNVTESGSRSQDGHGILARRQEPSCPAQKARPGIAESRARYRDGIPERRAELFLAERKHAHPVSEHAVSYANGHTAIALGIPGESHTGEKLVPLGAVEGVAAGILLVAREYQSGGRVLIVGTAHVLSEQGRIEMEILMVVFLIHGGVRLPADAVIDGEPPADLPVVLNIQGTVILAAIVSI
jgi:hypothetical protein